MGKTLFIGQHLTCVINQATFQSSLTTSSQQATPTIGTDACKEPKVKSSRQFTIKTLISYLKYCCSTFIWDWHSSQTFFGIFNSHVVRKRNRPRFFTRLTACLIYCLEVPETYPVKYGALQGVLLTMQFYDFWLKLFKK